MSAKHFERKLQNGLVLRDCSLGRLRRALAPQCTGNGTTVLHRATPERLSAFSDGVFAVLITVLVLELRPPELPTFSYAVSYLFYVTTSTLYRLDGRERTGAAAGCLRCVGFLPSKRDLHMFDLGAH